MYKIGEVVEGVVSGIQNYGAFVTLDDCMGLVHISEISSGFVRNIEDYLKLGEKYKFYVIDVDSNSNQVKLSYKKIHEDEERKTRSISKYVHLNKNNLYFKDTFYKVTESKECFEDDYLSINYNEVKEINKDINIEEFDFVKYPSLLMEKDILKIKLDCEKLNEENKKLVVVCNYSIYEALKAYTNFLNIDLNKIIFINSDASVNYVKEVIDTLNDDYVVLFIFKGEYSENEAIIYRLLRKKLEETLESTSDRFFFCYQESDEDINSLINKEWYTSFINSNLDETNILNPGILFVLSYLNVDIFNLIQGYRRGIIDNIDHKLYLKLIESNSNNLPLNSNHLNLKMYLNFFKNLNLSIDIEYKLDTLIQLPKYKDHLKKLKGKDGKFVNEVFNKDYSSNIIIKETTPFTLGYLTLLLYLLEKTKEA